MKNDLTRREFGFLSAALALTVTKSTVAWADDDTYENPELLVEVDEFLGAGPLSDASIAQLEAGELVLLDVRERSAFDIGHIPGARHVDPNAVVAEQSPVDGSLKTVSELERIVGSLGISANQRVVLYDDRGGFHAARMFWLLEYLGHRNVALLNGGWSAWIKAGGPASSKLSPYKRVTFHAAVSPRRYASAADVLAHRETPNRVLIDVRPQSLYDKGHIPWAQNVPWSKNLRENAHFKDAGHLLAHFNEHGITREKNVIMHCQNGLASAHSYVALRLLGFPRVRVYHRSWAEWGSDPDLPKATA